MKTTPYEGDVCSHTHSFFLDNFFRRLIQHPKKIVGNYIQKGDTVIDLGCGPGYFTVDMAQLTGSHGKVYAVDLQPEMLESVRRKAERHGLLERLVLHNCPQDRIGLSEDVKADFILAFYMVHETPDQEAFLKQVKALLKETGKFLLVEPRFHVSRKNFETLTQKVSHAGFNILDMPSKKGGRSLLLELQPVPGRSQVSKGTELFSIPDN